MVDYNLLWTQDEYEAVVGYIQEKYNKINILLSREVTTREIKDSDIEYIIPTTKEELVETLDEICGIYSAIIKNYIINGRKVCNRILFRGTGEDKTDMSFLSTTSSGFMALGFARGKILAINPGEVRWINISNIISKGDWMEEEHEFLFLPNEIVRIRKIDYKTFLSMIGDDEVKEIYSDGALKGKCNTCTYEEVELREIGYSRPKAEITLDDLLLLHIQYWKDLKTIRTTEKNSEEYSEAYSEAYKRIIEYKKKCSIYLYQRFYEINERINNQASVNNEGIKLPYNYDMEEVYIGNTGIMYQITDRENGQEYLFKPAVSKNGDNRSYRAYIQEAAYQIQQIINPKLAVRCNTLVVEGMFGAIQDKKNVDKEATKAFIDYFDSGIGNLSDHILSQIIDEYLVDYLLCNYDAKADNFIIDTDGNLRGIDKEQSWRYGKASNNEDTVSRMMFSTNYNEDYGENPTIYNIIFENIKQGKLPFQLLMGLRYRASRLAQFPDDEYKKIFERYVLGKAKTAEEAEELFNSIMDRKHSILQDIEQLCTEIYHYYSDLCRKKDPQQSSLIDEAVKETLKFIKIEDIERFFVNVINSSNLSLDPETMRRIIQEEIEGTIKDILNE